MEEAILLVFQSDGGQMALDIVTLSLCIWIIREVQRMRANVHERINELQKQFNTHEKECAERWGKMIAWVEAQKEKGD